MDKRKGKQEKRVKRNRGKKEGGKAERKMNKEGVPEVGDIAQWQSPCLASEQALVQSSAL